MYPQVTEKEYQYTWAEAERDLIIMHYKYLEWSHYLPKETPSEAKEPTPEIPSETK